MKSLANSLLNIAVGICEDVRLAYRHVDGLDLDCERLARNCRVRGLGFFSLDLPCLDSLLTSGLQTGRLTLEGPCSRKVSRRVLVPRFFSGLWLRIFDKSGYLKEEPDVNAIAFLRQIVCLGKRVQSECSRDRLLQAVKEYHDVEFQIRPPTLQWSSDGLDTSHGLQDVHLFDCLDDPTPLFGKLHNYGSDQEEDQMRSYLSRCQQVADIVVGAFNFFEPVTYSGNLQEEGGGTGFRHGPGAVSDRRGKFNKYEFPRWSKKLETWFPYRQCGTIASDVESVPLNHEVASKLIAVPKTAKGPRLIASEPTEHQWCQQLIRHFMVSELERLFGDRFICFSEQELSGQMALLASRNRSLCTIDLSSASDRLSCWLVERIFRKNPSLLHSLHAARTRYILDDISPERSFIKLKKFASQGTATTFPVQTLVFLVLALGACIEGKVTWSKISRLRHRVRVFGDDIIIPNSRYVGMTRVLHILGLKVNMEKSFHDGHFRESCGVDAYGGYDVTPIKPLVVIPDGPASRQAVLDTSNNLFNKGYWNASTVCTSTLGDRILRRLAIVGRDSGITGIHSFCGNAPNTHLKTRWNGALQRKEFSCWSLTSTTGRSYSGERPALLQYFTEAPATRILGLPVLESWKHGIAERPRLREKSRWDPLLPAYFALPKTGQCVVKRSWERP